MGRLVLIVAAVALMAIPAAADWIEEDGHKMHYPQLPDVTGWDVNATGNGVVPVVLADDWQCSESGYVTDIHFWGSWMHDMHGEVLSFTLSIHEDIPADPPLVPYSRPGLTLWEYTVDQSLFVIADPVYPPGPEGWYDPATGQFFMEDHVNYHQVNVFLSEFLPAEELFYQDSGVVYWLNISAIVADPATTAWGWKSTLDHFLDDAVWSEWYVLDWVDMWEPPLFDVSLDLSFVITSERTLDTCEFYKSPYLDYAPQGMPDFDQKQSTWSDGSGWTHCGPCAVANCLWWFDSRFEPWPVNPRPFGVTLPNDNYPLVQAYGGWDDHDTSNVQPLVNNLAAYLNTNGAGRGTMFTDLVNGTRQWISDLGLDPEFKDSVQPIPEFDFIKEQVLDCQDVILLLGFWEDKGTNLCYVGGHYVTVAGVCTTATRICISDPYFDLLEGNPPGAAPHGGTVHNDADNISGPHGQIQHDPYDIVSQVLPYGTSVVSVLPNYQLSASDIAQFEGQNAHVDWCTYTGGQLYVVIDFAYVICPDEPTGACCYDPTGLGIDAVCTITTEDSCYQWLGGTYMGDGTVCSNVQACCMPNGDCLDADSLCCIDVLGGNPQGAGTSCTTPQGCCMPDGTCQNVDPMCCLDLGGVPQGVGTLCTALQACCLDDGSGDCVEVDPLCCDEMGGHLPPFGITHCLGDNNGNGTDDACEDGWQPGDPHKMHWPQLPDTTGWNVNGTWPIFLADDWECSETGWVKDLHWWGSWRNGLAGVIDFFIMGIYADIPADQSPTGYSMPGLPLWERDIADFSIQPIDIGVYEGWYNPYNGETLIDDHTEFFQYNVYLPEQDWFWQDSGTIYWLLMSAWVEDTLTTTWGWKSTDFHFNDDAVFTHAAAVEWLELYEPDPPPISNPFNIYVDPSGTFVDGWGGDAYGDGWYYYPDDQWWNIWFYDHPFDSTRYKEVRLEFDIAPFDAQYDSYVEVAINWSTDQWSIDYPEDSMPPLPGVPEPVYIGRYIVYAGEAYPEHWQFDYVIPDYNPEWVSVDVRGYNFIIPGGDITHACLGHQSMDLSFVITGEAPPVVRDSVVCEPQGGGNPTHPSTYWYDVLPGDAFGRCDFHVQTGDSIAGNYSNWVEPAGWQHAVHKVGSEWWVSWWNTGCTNPITGGFRFQFDNDNSSTWGHWTTTTGASNDPFTSVFDSSGNHAASSDGMGYRVHVPSLGCCVPPMRGDINYDLNPIIDIADLVYLVDYMFTGGPAPPCFEEADVDASGPPILDIADLVYLSDYMFTGGPAPKACP